MNEILHEPESSRSIVNFEMSLSIVEKITNNIPLFNEIYNLNKKNLIDTDLCQAIYNIIVEMLDCMDINYKELRNIGNATLIIRLKIFRWLNNLSTDKLHQAAVIEKSNMDLGEISILDFRNGNFEIDLLVDKIIHQFQN